MPLHDHFRPPLSNRRHWQGFHSAWSNEIARELNQSLLPSRFFAEPNTQLGVRVEIDVATFEEFVATGADSAVVAAVPWAPPQPPLTLDVDFAELDVFEVQVFNDEEGPRLVAAIELVSPRNKDRPSARRIFAAKCAGYLQQGVSLLVVDIVTTRTTAPVAQLLELLSAEPPDLISNLSLYALACRCSVGTGNDRLQVWPESLAIGSNLPTLPLWISPNQAVPIDLEETYSNCCDSLRIST
jgi:hypothetical protein